MTNSLVEEQKIASLDETEIAQRSLNMHLKEK